RALRATALPPPPSLGTPPDPAPSTSAPIALAPRSTPPPAALPRRNMPHQTHPTAARVPLPISPHSLRWDKAPSAFALRQAWQSPRDKPPLPALPATCFPTTPWPPPRAKDPASSPPAIVAAPVAQTLLSVPASRSLSLVPCCPGASYPLSEFCFQQRPPAVAHPSATSHSPLLCAAPSPESAHP